VECNPNFLIGWVVVQQPATSSKFPNDQEEVEKLSQVYITRIGDRPSSFERGSYFVQQWMYPAKGNGHVPTRGCISGA
jgi:hypothetical protein